jgi:endonuclease G
MKKYALFLILLSFPLTGLYAQRLEKLDKDGNHPILEVAGHDTGQKIVRNYFYYSFDREHTQAAWVAYQLKFDPDTFVYERTEDYREDPKLGKYSPRNDEYAGSGLDRGHLAPAQDFAFGARAVSESFYLSNMSPQRPDFNQRGLWRKLEDLVRNWSLYNNNRLYIVAGPILTDVTSKIGKGSRISLPRKFFKVILCQDNAGQWQGIGFVVPNLDNLRNIQSYAVPIKKVEEMTGLNFFSSLNNSVENQIEQRFDPEFWQLNKK